MLKIGLTTERFTYDGKIFKVPETSIRPQPRHRDLMSRAVGAFQTTASLEAVARAGLGPVVVAPRGFEAIASEMVLFNKIR